MIDLLDFIYNTVGLVNDIGGFKGAKKKFSIGHVTFYYRESIFFSETRRSKVVQNDP